MLLPSRPTGRSWPRATTEVRSTSGSPAIDRLPLPSLPNETPGRLIQIGPERAGASPESVSLRTSLTSPCTRTLRSADRDPVPTDSAPGQAGPRSIEKPPDPDLPIQRDGGDTP